MITVISGTNRKDSNTLKVARHYQDVLKSKDITASFLSLEDFTPTSKDAAFVKVEQEILIPTRKFIMIIPEYNGSFPGVLKTMIDLSDIKNCWWFKKALLTGVSTGRAGNLRGMDHLSAVFHHMKMTVYPNMLPLSVVDKLMDTDGKIIDEGTRKVIDAQLTAYLDF
jgi:chromate reductase, NAD(P)H dehydrogenase (quinone)